MSPEDKIRKLLDLAGSPNEHEAKLALSRARELMAKYCIDIRETEAIKPVVTNEDYNPPIRVTSYNFKYCAMIVGTLSKHFGVIPLIYHNSTIQLFGFERSLKLAKYGFDAIFNQLNAAFKVGYSRERSIAYSEAFWYGAARGIHTKFELKKTDVSEAMTVYDPVYAKIAELQTGIFKSELNPASVKGQIQGETAGNQASFYKGINQISEKGNLLT